MAKQLGTDVWFEPTCFLCHEYFVEPITLDCGHDFCHSCILHTWRECTKDTMCPRCKEPVLRTNLKPHGQLAKAVRMIKWMCQERTVAEGSKVCKEHRQAVKYFCKDHFVTFCYDCEGSKEHLAHNAVPASEAAIEYKDDILNRIEALSKEKDDIEEHKLNMEKQWDSIIQQVETEKQRMLEQFEEMQKLITAQRNIGLSMMEDAKEKILLKKSVHLAEISREHTNLQESIWELQKKRQQRTLEFLQTAESTMEKCKKGKIANLVPLPREAREDTWAVQDFNGLLQIGMKQFEDTLENANPNPQKKASDEDLDPYTDYPHYLYRGGLCQAPRRI